MGDANVRRPVATRFEHGVDFGLLVHKSPFMADDRDPLVLSNYIFELLEVNPGVAGFLIQLHPDDVDAVVESVTAHAEKGAGTTGEWVVVHVMVKCIEGLYELWRVRELYTLTQVERHRALTTKFSKAWGDSGWSPTRWIHWCLAHSTFFAEKWRNIFQFSSIPTEYRHGPYKRRLKNCFKGWSLVRPSMSLRHMHHCMSMNALEQGLLGLEASKASDIDDFV